VVRDDRPPRDLIVAMTGAADPLEQAGDLAGTAVLDDVVDPSNVDPELHRGGTDQCVHLSLFKSVFDVDPHVTGQRAVVDFDRLAELFKTGAQRFGCLAGVDKN
jgi:hypothetical protein